MVLPLKKAVGSSIPASLNFVRPLSVTTTPRFFGSRWFASESRKTCREPEQRFVLWTSISTVTDSLIRLMASTGERFIPLSSEDDGALERLTRCQDTTGRLGAGKCYCAGGAEK